MRIKIVPENTDKIDATITEVEGRASVRLMTGADVMRLSIRAEEALENKGLSKKYRKGARACECECVTARSYRYQYESTDIVIERGCSAWYIVDVSRTSESPGSSWRRRSRLVLTEGQKKICIDRFVQTLDQLL